MSKLKRRKIKVSHLHREGLLDNTDVAKPISEIKEILCKFIDDQLEEVKSFTAVDYDPELTMVSISMDNVGYSFDEYTPVVKMALYRWETDEELERRENSRKLAQKKRREKREKEKEKKLVEEKALYEKLKKKFEDAE